MQIASLLFITTQVPWGVWRSRPELGRIQIIAPKLTSVDFFEPFQSQQVWSILFCQALERHPRIINNGNVEYVCVQERQCSLNQRTISLTSLGRPMKKSSASGGACISDTLAFYNAFLSWVPSFSRRADNIFKQLDERQLTESEEKIIQQRVRWECSLVAHAELIGQPQHVWQP